MGGLYALPPREEAGAAEPGAGVEAGGLTTTGDDTAWDDTRGVWEIIERCWGITSGDWWEEVAVMAGVTAWGLDGAKALYVSFSSRSGDEVGQQQDIREVCVRQGRHKLPGNF